MKEFLAIVALVYTTCGTVFFDNDNKSEELSDIVYLINFIRNWKSDKVHGEFFSGIESPHLSDANDVKAKIGDFVLNYLRICESVAR